MLALILSSTAHTLGTLAVLGAGALAIWLLPWRDEEVEGTRLAMNALARAARRRLTAAPERAAAPVHPHAITAR